MKADGSILIDTKILDGGMEKGFELIKDEMASVGITAKEVGEQIELSFSKMDVSKPIEKAFEKVMSLQKEFENIDFNFQGERDKLKQMESELANALKYAGDEANVGFNLPLEEFQRYKNVVDTFPREIEKQKQVVDSLEKKWTSAFNTIKRESKRLTEVITAEVNKQAAAEEKAAKKAANAAEKEAAAKQRAAEKQFNDLTRPARRFNSRLREIISGALVFNLLSAGLREMTSYFGTALKANTEFSASFGQLKGALLTAFQPIYEVVLPALIQLMRILTAIVQVVGSFFAAITGKSSSQMAKNAQALNKQADAIGGVGDAAEEAAKQLAGFDEINRLESMDTSTGGGGGAGAGGEVLPNFEPMEITEDLERILALVGSIAAGLLAWKIASMFTDSLSTAAGLGIAVGGALLYAYNWADAFANGISWENLSGMLTGMLVLAGGLALAFGSVGAAVGLLIGSVGLIIATVAEFNKTGEVTNEMLAALALAIAGIGAAISLVTGNWLPLIIGLLTAFGVALGATNEDVRNFVEGVLNWFLQLWEWLKGIFQAIVDNWNSIWSGINQYHTTGTIGPQTYSTSPTMAAYSVTPEIPALARGAVLPANKPFLAMVGDQKNGTNIEAPLETIKQALSEVMAQQGWDVNVEFHGELAALARILAPVITKEQRRNTIARGL